MSRLKFTSYKEGALNELCLVVSDEADKEEEDVPVKSKTPQEASDFVDELIAFCKARGFEVNSFGTKSAMINRFFRKSGQEFYTEYDMLLWGRHCYFTADQNEPPPSRESFGEWEGGKRFFTKK